MSYRQSLAFFLKISEIEPINKMTETTDGWSMYNGLIFIPECLLSSLFSFHVGILLPTNNKLISIKYNGWIE